ncbi:hypothetical protein H5410_026725 [Solanum commersonii]|uniref:Uncharacterized protein n=1 Tax=Solanum commersonii TaxID=4109 RepID=A0A9J5YXC0_SOLCO|nr:hypothetical protein H5410_026725 [Solanum commersonii]
MSMEVLRQNSKHANNCKVKFNGNIIFEIPDPSYKHGIYCAHALITIHYNDWVVESFVDDWYNKETYLNAYNKFIQSMKNIKMWPKSTRSVIEPPEINSMPGRPDKNKKKNSDELVKKKFEKATRKGRKMKCLVCKTFEHNKKGCSTLISCALMSFCY